MSIDRTPWKTEPFNYDYAEELDKIIADYNGCMSGRMDEFDKVWNYMASQNKRTLVAIGSLLVAKLYDATHKH